MSMNSERALKKSIAIFICILFYKYYFLDIKDNLLLISAVNAVYGSKDRTIDTINFSKYRICGTLAGCFWGSLYLVIQNMFEPISSLSLFVIPVIAYFSIIFYRGEHQNILTRATIMPFLTLTLLTAPTKDLTYVKFRVVATMIGLLISLLSTIIVDNILSKIDKRK